MQLDKIQNTSPKIPELIMQSLIGAIEAGHIHVGEELPSERELAESLGVGRGSLRECLAILEFLGAIESRGNRKVLLRNADFIQKVRTWIESANQMDTRRTFNEFRQVIEVGIVKLACERATDEDIAAMATAVEHLKENPSKYEYDVEFHDSLAVASHNSMLAATIHLVNNLIADVRIRFWDLPDYQERTQQSHYAIYQAVCDRDVERAQLEMSRHLAIVDEFSEKYPGRSMGEEGRRSLARFLKHTRRRWVCSVCDTNCEKADKYFFAIFSKAKK